jgi:hypothetical protein
MRRKLRRVAAVAAIVGAGGMMMVSPNFACESFAGESLFTAIDTCFIFDCQSGAFGGVLQPCGIALFPNPADPLSGGPLFTDCVPGTNNPFATGP